MCNIVSPRQNKCASIVAPRGELLVVSHCAFILVTFFASSLPVLLVGETLCGLPWGVFQTLTCAYAAEIAPTALRFFLTTFVNLCWVLGQFFSSAVLEGVSGMDVNDQWAYRIPFALQWVWPIPILIGVFFATESPYFLVRQGRIEEAKAALRELGSEKPAWAFQASSVVLSSSWNSASIGP